MADISSDPIIIEAVVMPTTAQQQALKETLSQKGFTGPISYEINKTLIAGLKLNLGDKVVDLTVKYRLGQISQELTSHVQS